MPQNNPIDPNAFQASNLLNIILVNTFKGSTIADAIKWDTGGDWSHAMIQRAPGKVVTQSLFLEEIPLSKYMTAGNILGFFTINNLTADEWKIINDAIDADLAKPAYKRFYNFLGILGQALKLPDVITFPGLDYCSERDAEYIRLIPRLQEVTPAMPNPVQLGKEFMLCQNLFSLRGYWWEKGGNRDA